MKSNDWEADIALAMEVIHKANRASTARLQRELGWGFNHAARIIDLLEDRGIIGPQIGARPREVLK